VIFDACDRSSMLPLIIFSFSLRLLEQGCACQSGNLAELDRDEREFLSCKFLQTLMDSQPIENVKKTTT